MTYQGVPSFEDLEPEGVNTGSHYDLEKKPKIDFCTTGDAGLESLDLDEIEKLETLEDLNFEYGADDYFSSNGSGNPNSSLQPELPSQTYIKRFRHNSGIPRLDVNKSCSTTRDLSNQPVSTSSEKQLDHSELAMTFGASEIESRETQTTQWLANYRLMKMLARLATTAANVTDAQGFVAAMVPLSFRHTPSAYRAFAPALPMLIRRAMKATRSFYTRKASRALIRLMPIIICRTTSQLARRLTLGRRVTPYLAVIMFEKQVGVILQARPGTQYGWFHQQRSRKVPWGIIKRTRW